MKNKTTIITSVMGVIAGIAGMEHGVGEILQGNVNAPGIFFSSWPESDLFATMAGEPAMSLIPNMLISGYLSISIAVVLIYWSIRQKNRKYYGYGFLGISAILLLVGGGFGPPLLGIILGGVTLRIKYRKIPGKYEAVGKIRNFFANIWKIFFLINLTLWLFLFPILPLLSWLFNYQNDMIVAFIAPAAFIFLAFALTAANEWDKIHLLEKYNIGNPNGYETHGFNL